MLKTIGRAHINFTRLLDDLESLKETEKQECVKNRDNNSVWRAVYAWIDENCKGNQRDGDGKTLISAYHKVFDERSPDGIEAVRECIESTGAVVRCILQTDRFVVTTLGGNESTLLLPPDYVSVKSFISYDALTASERHALLGGPQSADSDTALTESASSFSQVKAKASGIQAALKDLETQADNIKNGNVEGLQDMKAEIERLQAKMQQKQVEMMAELKRRMAEMNVKKEQMEFEIYKLDSEIYSIRCYTGECVNFTLIRDGLPAPADTPLVLHQRMRYMEEELGKLASIYDADFADSKALEDVLRYNDLAFETFVPTKRSITLCRVSRNNKVFSRHEKWANMLHACEKYHGRTIAILIRDGDKLYIAWTDDTRIAFPENMFFKPGVSEEAPGAERRSYEPDEAYEERIKREAKQQLDEAVGRKFVFSTLQGVIDRQMLQFPDGTDLRIMCPSPLVVYSYADAMITDERYGSLNDMISRANQDISNGDMILTMQNLRPERREHSLGWMNDTWNNDRGRGERNRTHDVHASDCSIYPINLVEDIADYEISFEWHGVIQNCTWFKKTEAKFHEKLERSRLSGWKIAEGTEVAKRNEERHIYISLKKEWSMSGTARANFEIFPEEFMNLNFLCSTWLKYILQQHKTGRIRIGGEKVDFAYLLPYLKVALDHIRKREADELALLAEHIPNIAEDAEWPAKLCEWKITNHIHNFTAFQAKRFAKAQAAEKE